MDLISIIVAVFSIIGSVLGAGFMTGTEIYGFFARFGSIAYITIAINCVVFGLFIVIYSIKNAKNEIFGFENHQKNYILYFCQLLITGTMVAGVCTLLTDFGVTRLWATPIILLFVFVCNLVGIRSANFVNVIVTCFACVSFLFVAYDGNWQPLGEPKTLVMPLLMVGFYLIMNMASSEAVVKSACVGKKKLQIWMIGLLVGLMLMIMLYTLVGLATHGDMPLISIIKNTWFKKVYSVIVLMAMVSTMLSSAFGAKRLFNLNNLCSSFFVAIIACIVSFVGFKNLIFYVYPFIGTLLAIKYIFGGLIKFAAKKA